MSVISGVFQGLADRAGLEQPSELLAHALLRDPTATKGDLRKIAAAKMADRNQAAEFLLQGLSNDVQVLGDALDRVHAPVTLRTSFMPAANNKLARMTVTLESAGCNIFTFEATPIENGGYYVESETNIGSHVMTLTMGTSEPVDDIDAAENAVVKGLNATLGPPPYVAEKVLKILPLFF